MSTRATRMSDEAVSAATGRDWSEWIAILDEYGAAKMKHAGIARLVAERHDVSGWWAQTVTVEYERERGLRDVHQTSRGYEVSVSKTISASVEALFAVWNDELRRDEWTGARMKVRKANLNRSMRLETGERGSDLSVSFYAKGQDRCQVVVHQTKLPNRDAVEDRRAFWKDALSRLGEAAAYA